MSDKRKHKAADFRANRRAIGAAQVHRFGDSVAVYIGTGETVYLQPKVARAIARAVNAIAKSCESERFTDSTCGTHEFRFGEYGESI